MSGKVFHSPKKEPSNQKELERILDFKSGNNQYSASEKFSVPTMQSDYYGDQYDKKSGITPNLVEVQNNRIDNETNSKVAKYYFRKLHNTNDFFLKVDEPNYSVQAKNPRTA